MFGIVLELVVWVSCIVLCVLEVDIVVSSNDLHHFQPQISKRIQDGRQYPAPKDNIEWGYDEDFIE